MSGILAALAGIKTAIATAVDEYFNRVTLLLNTSSTNGAQNNTFLDSSTNNFTITRNGNTTQGTFTPFSQTGWSNYFNGTNSYMTLGGTANLSIGTSDFEISLWAYWNSVGTQVLYEGRPGSNGAYPVILTNSSVLYYFVNSSNAITGPTVVANQWYYITVSRVSGTTKMFVNGSQVGSNYTDSTNYGTGGTAPWIGAGYAPGDYMNGYISNLRVVVGSGVASQTVPTTPLTAITNTKLLTCQSNRFVDSSASPLTLTVNGTLSVQAFSPFLPTAAYDPAVVGGSGYFDGTGDFLQLADSTAWDLTGDYTIEMWLYSTATPVSTTFFQLGSSSNFLAIYLSSATKYITTAGSLSITASTALALNSWNHMALVRSGSGTNNTVLYLNGVNVGQATNTTSFTGSASNGVRIGAEYPSDYYFNGYIAGNRIVNGTAVYTANFTPPTAPPTAITNTSLLANYTNAGIYDSASKNVLETVGNAQVSTTQAKWGTASMYFNPGETNPLVIPNNQMFNLSSGDFTIEFWVYLSSDRTFNYVISKGGASTREWAIYVGPTNVSFYWSTNGSSDSSVTGSATIPTSTWMHIAVTKSGSNIRLFKDGTQVGSTGTFTSMYSGTSPVYVGRFMDYNNISHDLSGYIDDLRITKGYARYTANFTPPTAAFPVQ